MQYTSAITSEQSRRARRRGGSELSRAYDDAPSSVCTCSGSRVALDRGIAHYGGRTGVAELADAAGLKPAVASAACGFKSHPRYQRRMATSTRSVRSMEQVHERVWRIPSEFQPGRFTNVYVVRGTRTALIDMSMWASRRGSISRGRLARALDNHH